MQVDSIIVMIFVIGRYGHGRRYNGEGRDGFLGFLDDSFGLRNFCKMGLIVVAHVMV